MTNIVKNKNGIEFDIDAIATDLNGKMDRDGNNAECPTLLSRTPNNQGGVVELWSDGYCVQTGIGNTSGTYTFSEPFIDTNYIITATPYYYSPSAGTPIVCYFDKTTTSVFLQARWNGSGINTTFNYRIEGYIR